VVLSATSLSIAAATGHGFAFEDAEAFSRRVQASAFFAHGSSIAIARAPGRLDVLGGIADYSGSLVLELPLEAAALAAAQERPDGRVVAVSGDRRIAMNTAELLDASLDSLRRRFAGRDGWAAYVLGPVALLLREEQVEPRGLRLLVSSGIPEGKGLGSSAAVEVAVLRATAACVGIAADARRLALCGQRAEQIFADAPCGAMDQLAVTHGEAGRLLALLCRPGELVASIPLPDGLALWGIDSGLRHAVSGDTYRRVRCATFMGKALLAQGEEYLAGVDPADVDLRLLPEQMLGADFLRISDGIADPLSAVEPAVVYPVRAATLFPLEEHERVQRFADLLEQHRSGDVDELGLLGELMYASHAGYSRCGLGVPRTDELVDAVRRAGGEEGLIGARVSGGGSGGTVVVLGRTGAEPHVRAIAEELGAGLVGGTSPGAEAFGVRFVGGDGRSRP
jgi:galactokinase